MDKLITPEVREACAGDFLVAEDFLDTPMKLRVVALELKKDEVESSAGKMMDKVIFYFENSKGEEKEIGVLSFDGLARQMIAADPQIGDIVQLETIQTGGKYLTWKVDIVTKAKAGTKAPARKGKPVKKEEPADKDFADDDDKDEKIKLEDIPF